MGGGPEAPAEARALAPSGKIMDDDAVTTYRTLIHGSCVSRDTFEFLGPEYQLVDYVARQSLISSMTGPVEGVPEPPLVSAFQERMRQGDLLGDGLDRVVRRRHSTDVILWDLCDERLGVFEVARSRWLTDSVERRTRAPLPLRRVEMGTEQHFDLWCRAANSWHRAVRETAPDVALVLVALPWAEVSDTGVPTPPSYGVEAAEANDRNGRYYAYAAELGVPVVGANLEVLATERHKWGFAPFHYTDSVYEETARLIRAAVADVFAAQG